MTAPGRNTRTPPAPPELAPLPSAAGPARPPQTAAAPAPGTPGGCAPPCRPPPRWVLASFSLRGVNAPGRAARGRASGRAGGRARTVAKTGAGTRTARGPFERSSAWQCPVAARTYAPQRRASSCSQPGGVRKSISCGACASPVAAAVTQASAIAQDVKVIKCRFSYKRAQRYIRLLLFPSTFS
jgi:hypothetical protein